MPVTYVDKIYYNNSQYSRGYKGSELLWDKKPDFFYIENLYNGLNTLTLKKTGSPTTGSDIQWSGDLVTWTPVTYDANNEFLIGIPNQSQKIYFRSSTGFSYDVDNYFTFTASESHSVGGDARTLIDYTNSSLNTAVASCLRSLFDGDTELTDASTLDLSKITILAVSCYRKMFNGCTSLTKVPALPATTLEADCYNSMFRSCTSLTKAPDLPATMLASSCYNSMFSRCSALVSAPALPATTLAADCYNSMFYLCSSLNEACTELPATVSASQCYYQMYCYCSALEYSPDIYCSPDTTKAFMFMFYGCSSLREIRIHSTTWDTTNTTNWVTNVAASGWLYNFAQITTIPTGNDGIPTGWTQTRCDYLKITNEYNGSNTISLYRRSAANRYVDFSYSTDGGSTWNSVSISRSSSGTVWSKNLNAGESILFKGSSSFVNKNSDVTYSTYIYFSSTEQFSISGNIMFLLDTTGQQTSLSGKTYCFYYMFAYSKVTDASKLKLPATTLADYCYCSMFLGCNSLTKSPVIPAATLANDCYNSMFTNCTSLNNITYYGTTLSGSYNWVANVAPTGDFYNLGGASIASGASGIPSGWTEHTTL